MSMQERKLDLPEIIEQSTWHKLFFLPVGVCIDVIAYVIYGRYVSHVSTHYTVYK